MQAFADLTGDTNALHTSPEAAAQQGLFLDKATVLVPGFIANTRAGFEGCLVPGALCASLFPAVIGRNFPGALYALQKLKFSRPVLVWPS